MDRKEKFFNDDKVVRVGTKTPVMTIKGKTMKGGLPYQYFVKKLSGNSAIIYKFIDMVSIFSRVCINTEHVNKSL